MPKEFCATRSRLVSELAIGAGYIDKIVNRIRVVPKLGNRAHQRPELGANLNAEVKRCVEVHEKLKAHRFKHNC
jgi:hypothetical protein